MTNSQIKMQMPVEKLTVREVEVMTHTAFGKTRGEISLMLSISEKTVKSHLAQACRKLKASNKTHAVTIALTLGLIEACCEHGRAPVERRAKVT